MSKKFVIPAESGKRGLPPGVGSSNAPKKGIVSPCELGSKGKPHNKSFPGTKPARD